MLEEHTATLQSFIDEHPGYFETHQRALARQQAAQESAAAAQQAAQEKLAAELRNAEKSQLKKKKKRKPG